MKITLITDPEAVNSNYRAYQPMHVLSAQGHQIFHNDSRIPRWNPATLRKSDVVLIHRYFDPEIRALARQLRQAGTAVVWDNDDDVLAVPRSNPLYRQYGGTHQRAVLAGVREMVQLAHLVTSSSRCLIEQFQMLGATHTLVLENYVRDDFIVSRRADGDRLIVGWLAGLEHQLDYQALRLRESLERLLSTHPGVDVISVGIGLGLSPDRYRHTKQAEFLELPQHLREFDIGIAPLAHTPFNRARSNIKLKEYAAAGVPWLASPVGGYVGMSESEGGVLVGDSDWYDALDRMLSKHRERNKLAKRAAKWARTQTISRNAHLWSEALEDARERARMRSLELSDLEAPLKTRMRV